MSETSRTARGFRIALIVVASLFAIIILSIVAAVHLAFDTDGITKGAEQKTATAKDGTSIAYERTGKGPVVILGGSALADRGAAKRLGKHLSEHFKVVNYDKRGRGKSGD